VCTSVDRYVGAWVEKTVTYSDSWKNNESAVTQLQWQMYSSSRYRWMLWKSVENRGTLVVERADPKQLRQPAGASGWGTEELYRPEHWARPTTELAARGSSPIRCHLLMTSS